jgi:hypothetical protein
VKISPHILIDQDLAALNHAGCPPMYETLVLRNITRFYTDSAISLEEFDHYCKRLDDAIAHKPRSAT